ncbi:MAG: carbon storage regulator [Synergistales bacterium]|nr:carbon storage regulator [Synergistales bacterium]
MLVLSRRSDEAILLSNGVRIVVTKIGRNCVKLGIEAPRQVEVLREELLEKRRPQECEVISQSVRRRADSV